MALYIYYCRNGELYYTQEEIYEMKWTQTQMVVMEKRPDEWYVAYGIADIAEEDGYLDALLDNYDLHYVK